MSSSTARLGLKRPDGSDPFLRSDFVDNLNKMDANPGYVPCLSTSRPAWGAAQAGMLISETDTGRILRWTGSAWAPPTNMGQAWSIGTNPGLIMANNTASTITVAASIPVPRTCKMLVMLTIRLALGALHEQAGSLDVWIDSTTAGVGGPVNWVLPSTGDSSNSIATH